MVATTRRACGDAVSAAAAAGGSAQIGGPSFGPCKTPKRSAQHDLAKRSEMTGLQQNSVLTV